MRDKEQNPNIDFSRYVNSDCIDEALDVVKGVSALLASLELSNEAGHGKYDKHAFYALQIALQHGIDEIDGLKPNIEYMGEFMRYERWEKKL